MRLAKSLLFFSLTVLPLVAADVPRKSPEFAAQTPAGGQLLLSQYKGKVIVLEFAFTTCSHCQASARLLTQLYKEYGPKGFQPLAVAFNDMAGMLVPDFVKQNGVTFPVGFSLRDPVLNYLQLSPDARLSVPQIVIIDRKGMIRQQSLVANDDKTATEANLRNMIETLLKEPAAAGPPTKKTTTSVSTTKKPS
jgi:thiol-disulfide isomerase/thioredoxin